MLRQRKLNQHKNGLFNKTIDCTLIDHFLQDFASKLPQDTPQSVRHDFLQKLRQAYIGNHKAFETVLRQPNEMSQLLEQSYQASFRAKSVNDDSAFSFLQSLAGMLIKSKLGLLSLLAAPAAAGFNFTYHEGMPAGGKDLCADSIRKCIQGYLTEIGQSWQPDMTQIAGEVGQSSIADDCMTQQVLERLLQQTYRGPGQSGTACDLVASTYSGSDLMVNATSVDQITCNLMQDKLNGLAADCHHPAAPLSSDDKLLIGVGVFGGVSVLMLTGFILFLYCRNRRANQKDAELTENTRMLN